MPHLPDFLYKFFDANDQTKAAQISALLDAGSDYLSLVGAGSGRPSVTLVGKGGDPLGIADSSAAMQTCIDTVAALGGGDVILDAGSTFLWSSAVPKLPRNLVAPIRIIGYGATVRLSQTAPRFLDFNKVADHDTFQHIYVQGVTIDANNVTGLHHVILGTFIGGATQQRINLHDIEIRDVTTTNVRTQQATPLTSAGFNVSLTVGRTAAGTGTDGPGNTITNIRCINVQMSGGNEGIAITGTGPNVDNINVFLDNILIENCHHDTGVIPSGFYPANNFQVGSLGYGGTATIRDCTGKGSADDGVEVNSLDRILVENTHITNTPTAFFCDNFHTPQSGSVGQKITFRDCSANYDSDWASAGLANQGWAWAGSAAPLGHLLLEDCNYHKNSTALHFMNEKVGEAFGKSSAGGGVMKSLTLRNFKALIEGAVYSGSTTNYHSIIALDITCPKVVVEAPDLRMSADLTGWAGLASGFVGIWLDNTAGGPHNFSITDPYVEHALTGEGGHSQMTRMIQLQSSSTGIHGAIVRPKLGAGGSSQPVLLMLNNPVGVDRPVVLEDADWSAVAAAVPVVQSGTATTDIQVRRRRRVGLTYGATVVVPVMEGDVLSLGVSNGTAFTVSDPVQTTAGNGAAVRNLEFSLEIANSSGGAMGAVTWGAAYYFDPAVPFAAPAAGHTYVYNFRYNGTVWVNTSRIAA